MFGRTEIAGSEDRRTLEYFAERSCSRQWRDFLMAMLAEFREIASESELERLLTSVGARWARLQPLPPCHSLEDLQAALNALWGRIDWGWVGLEETGRFLKVTHGGLPAIDAEGSAARALLPPVLQGAYTHWLASQGGDPAFQARCVSAEALPVGPVVLHYGRHASP